MKPILISVLSLALLVSSCASDEEKSAQSMIQQARTDYTQGSYDSAIQILDSLQVTYPTLVEVRKEAFALAQEIKLAKSTADSARVAPMLEEAVALLEEKYRDFRELKYPGMPDETILRYNGIDASSATEQPFLDAYLDHDARLQLIAGCSAPQLQGVEYITVEETGGGTYVPSDTIPYDGGRNYRFTVDGRNYERLTLSTEAGARIAALVADTPDTTPIRVTFYLSSGKKGQSFSLPNNARAAIKGCYDYFSTYISIKNMEDVLQKHEQRRLLHYRPR